MRAALTGLLFCVASIANAVPGIQHGTNDQAEYVSGTFSLDVEDLRVKVQGGYLRSTRTYSGGGWSFNRRWAPLSIESVPVPPGFTGRPKLLVQRNGVFYLGTAGGRLIKQIDANENVVDYTSWIESSAGGGFVWRDHLGNLVEYDAQGISRAYEDRNGNRVSLQRAEDGRLLSANGPLGLAQLTYSYETASFEDPDSQEVVQYQRVRAVSDHTGRTVEFDYGPDRRLVAATDPLGRAWTYTYGPDGFLSGVVDPEGRTTTVSIDPERGQMRSWRNDDGVGFDFSFSASGAEMTQIRTDGEGRRTTSTFNKVGLPIRESRSGEQIYSVRYITTAGKDEFSPVGFAEARASSPGRANASASTNSADNSSLRSAFSGDGPHTIRQRIIEDQRGRVTTHTLDERGNIVRTVRPDGSASTTAWNARFSFPQRTESVDGVVTTWSYDGSGNLEVIREAAGSSAERATHLSYDEFGNVVEVRYAGDAQTTQAIYRFTYDDFGNLLTRTDPLGGVLRYTNAENPAHDALGNAPVIVNERGKTWVISYDPVGNLTSVRDPIGREESYVYNLAGDLIEREAANGGRTTYEPNHSGLPLSVRDPLDRVTSFRYNDANQVDRIEDPLGATVRAEFDQQGRILRSMDPNGNSTSFTYEAGLLRSTQFPTYRQDLRYDELDRVVEETDVADGLATRLRGTEYDAFGNPRVYVDALQRSTDAEYDELRQVVRILDPLDGATRFSYDDRGNLLSLTDPEGRTTQYSYDANDRRVLETRPGGAAWAWTYLPDGLPETSTSPEGVVTRYGYDDAGQLTSTRYYASNADFQAGSPSKVVTFAYDALGQMAQWDDGTYSATYSYNLAGELTSSTVDYGAFTKSQGYTYDAAGRKATYTNPEGVTYTYRYDPSGNLLSVDIPGEGAVTMNGYLWYAPNRRTYPGGVTMEDVYDPVLRLQSREVRDAGGNLITNTFLQYDAEDQLTRRERDAAATEYLYDDLDRLIEDTAAGERFGYDGVGNRVSTNGLPNWVYGENHELLSTGATSYTYTLSGNRASKTHAGETWTYAYNLENRLVRVTSSTDGELASMTYDPLGRRLSKNAGGETLYFLYDESGLLGEYDSSGALVREYQYSPGDGWMANPLFLRSPEAGVLYYALDHLSSPSRLFDQTGATRWQAEWTAFGHPLGEQALRQPLRFPGQYADPELGTHYNLFRDYDPTTGTYLQADPIGLALESHLYRYAFANPVGNRDVLGLMTIFNRDGTLNQSIVDAAAGFGDGITLGLTGGFRKLFGYDDQVDRCSGSYVFSTMAGSVLPIGGGARLFMRGFVRRPGDVWSHSIADRYFRPLTLRAKKPNPVYKPWLPKWLRNHPLNGNFVSKEFHYRTDPYYHPKGHQLMPNRYHRHLRMLLRTPGVVPGSLLVGGSVVRDVSVLANCACEA